MEFEDQPLAEARGRSTTMDKMVLLADKLFDEDPQIKHLLAEVLQQLQQQEDEIQRLREELAAFREEVALERAYDRQRLARLEAPTPPLREETAAAHLDLLASEMRRLGHKQVTTKDAARLIGVGKRHVNRLEPLLAADHRFQIIKDPNHKQRHLIRFV